ncbi:hypothetical protein HPB50_019538 [Hyalomma asiaticum]|uniref:Uncharacterized protein n=1 Tax=Hyalomma asiaticum TaxID=266040 RepID=A0ACB7SY01_HYAAI|nr:hypothetical protein HPB50_019538 [Hyalomma asiaticum]
MQLFKESPPEDSDETERSFVTAILLKGSKVLAYITTFRRRALWLGAFQSHTSTDDVPDPRAAQRTQSQPYTNDLQPRSV